MAGDYGFDPLNLQDAIADKWIETAKAAFSKRTPNPYPDPHPYPDPDPDPVPNPHQTDFSKGDERDNLTMKADVKANVAKAEVQPPS